MKNKLEGQLEALLYLFGEPVKKKKLADILKAKPKAVEEALEGLRNILKKEERGLMLVASDDGVQLVTKPEYGELLREIAKEDLDSALSPASMETLSIIAYLGPCRRSFVDHIRGVNSSFILRSLLVRGLIERGVDAKRANAYTYQVTFDFLRHMGVEKIEDLPDYEKYREYIGKFTGEDENETNA